MRDKEILVLAAKRLPQGRFGGSLAGHGAVNLGQYLTRRLLDDASLPRPSKVIWGMARSHTQGMNPSRTIAIKAGLPVDTSAVTVNMACGSSLQALIFGAGILSEGAREPILIGGSEAMSDTPHLLPDLRWGYRKGHRAASDVMHQDGLLCPITGLLMGETIEHLAMLRGVNRQDSDALALQSHRGAGAADFSAELIPHPDLPLDECPNPDMTMEALASRQPVFREDGQITAGNASTLSDGAAAVLLARKGHTGGAEPIAKILGWAEAGVDPLLVGEAPVPAVQRLLRDHGLSVRDVALWELNEAFSAQVLVCSAQLGLPMDRLNVAGGGVALGHPIGASGARIVVTLIHQLRQRGGGLGVATLGIGGGLGLAVLLEVH